MVVISISINPQLLEKFDNVIAEKGFATRSEGFRDLIRTYVDEWEMSEKGGINIAAIMMLSDRHKPQTALRGIQHKYHEIQTMLHTHLDDENCLEIFIVKGESPRIKDMIKGLRKVQGVKRVDFFTTTPEL
jgi:CopG family nickel-responsive transcriptional regulator